MFKKTLQTKFYNNFQKKFQKNFFFEKIILKRPLSKNIIKFLRFSDFFVNSVRYGVRYDEKASRYFFKILEF